MRRSWSAWRRWSVFNNRGDGVGAQTLLSPQFENVGFSFLIEGTGDDIQFKLRGKSHGFACALVLYPVRGQGAVVMTNSDNEPTLIDEILGALSETYQWPQYKPLEKQAATRFYTEGKTLFYSTDPYIRIPFLRDEGPIEGLVLWQRDFELQAKKK